MPRLGCAGHPLEAQGHRLYGYFYLSLPTGQEGEAERKGMYGEG